jgi:hypothetical protein
MACAILSACSPPHAVRIQLDNTWSPQDRLQVYLRRTAENGGTFSETDFIMDANEHSGTELVVMLDNGEGVLDVSVSKIDSNNCKLKCATKSDVDISTESVTDVQLWDSRECLVPWPARCDCYLGWCSVASPADSYVAVTGFRDKMRSAGKLEYQIWAVSDTQAGLFEIDPDSSDAVLAMRKYDVVDPRVQPRSLVIARGGGTNYLWALSQQGVYRKNIASQAEYLQPWNSEFMPEGVVLNRISAVPDDNPVDNKIYIAGSRQKRGAILHYQLSNWPDVLDDKMNLYGKALHGIWIGAENQRIVAVGESGAVIEKTAEQLLPQDRSIPQAATKKLNTVTCIDTKLTKCWVAGARGAVYFLDEFGRKNVLEEPIIRPKDNKIDLSEISFYASINMTNSQQDSRLVWMVGDKDTVLFFNGKVWRWLQVKNRAAGERGKNGKSIELSETIYRDIWAADEQNVWIVGSGGQVRVIDPTVPL